MQKINNNMTHHMYEAQRAKFKMSSDAKKFNLRDKLKFQLCSRECEAAVIICNVSVSFQIIFKHNK